MATQDPKRDRAAHVKSSADFSEKSQFQQLSSSLFGFDFFISYRWFDGRDYAVELAEQLERGVDGKRYKCFLDSEDYAKGDDWKQAGKDALEKTSILIVVGTPGTLSSEPVIREVRLFTERKNRVIPIEFVDDEGIGTLHANRNPSALHQFIRPEVLRIKEPLKYREDVATQLAGPSEDVVKQIAGSFDLITQEDKRTRVFAFAAFVFATVAMLAIVFWRSSEANFAEAERQKATAVQNEQNAKQNLVTSQFLVGDSSSEKGLMREAVFAYWQAYANAPKDDPRQPIAADMVSSWASRSGLRLPHDEYVISSVFSPEKNYVVTGCQSKAYVWNIMTGEPIGEPLRHDSPVFAIAVSPDGSTIATGTHDCAYLWNLRDASPAREMVIAGDDVVALAFSPDGSHLLTGSKARIPRTGYGQAQVWSVSSGEQEISPIVHHFEVALVAFSPDGKKLAIGSGGSAPALIFDAQSGEQFAEVGFNGSLRGLAFSPDSSLIATASFFEQAAQIFDASTGQPKSPILVHEGGVTHVEFAPDGRTILTSDDTESKLWEVATGELIGILIESEQMSVPESLRNSAHEPGSLRDILGNFPGLSVDFHPSSNYIVAKTRFGTAQLWCLHDRMIRPFGSPLQQDGYVEEVEFDPSGNIVLTRSSDKSVTLWNLGELLEEAVPVSNCLFQDDITFGSSGKQLQSGSRMFHGTDAGGVRTVLVVRFSPDGEYALSGGFDGEVRLWSTATHSKIGNVMRHSDRVVAIAFSSDGTRAVTGSFDGYAKIWSIPNCDQIGSSLDHKGVRVTTVAISPNGRLVATGASTRRGDLGHIDLWNVPSDGTPVFEKAMTLEGEVNTVKFSPDGGLLLSGCGVRYNKHGYAQLWHTATGKAVGSQLNHLGPVTDVAFHPSGSMIATGGLDNSVSLWDVETRRLLKRLRLGDALKCIAFSPDGKMLATGAGGKVLVWDLETGSQYGCLAQHCTVHVVKFSEDSMRIASVGLGDTLQAWKLALSSAPKSGQLRKFVELHTGYRSDTLGNRRDLSHPEWLDRWK